MRVTFFPSPCQIWQFFLVGLQENLQSWSCYPPWLRSSAARRLSGAKAQHCCTYNRFLFLLPTYFLSPCKLLTPSVFFGETFMALPLATWRGAFGCLATRSLVLFAVVDLIPAYLLLALLPLHCCSASFSISSSAILMLSYFSPSYSFPFWK